MKSYLELVAETDSCPYPNTPAYSELFSSIYTLHGVSPTSPTPVPIGYLIPSAFTALTQVPTSIRGELDISHSARTVTAFQQPTEEERSAAVAATCEYWRAQKTFDLLSGWRDERYAVYGLNNELLFKVERSASPILGIVTSGVHMSCYVRMSPEQQAEEGSKYDLKLWIPRRSRHKTTFSGLLDNTVAGGLAAGEIPFECLVREADEEASLPEKLVRENAKNAGGVTYSYVREERAGGESGMIQPECEYIYDLELPTSVVPQPKDGEVEEFYLWTVEETQKHLRAGEFKANCALVMVDFFLRWGILTKENEKDYDEIKNRCHREFEFPGRHEDIY